MEHTEFVDFAESSMWMDTKYHTTQTTPRTAEEESERAKENR